MAGPSIMTLVITAGGGVLIYSAVKGKSVSDVARALLTGQNPTTVAGTGDTATTTSSSGSVAPSGDISGNNKINEATAKMLATPYGWGTGNNWTALVNLWTRESGFSNTANNPSSGAYGIAQALPASKYPQPGRPPSMGGISDPNSQIIWGLNYIKSRYGNPVQAWAHETSAGWY